jgi:transposase
MAEQMYKFYIGMDVSKHKLDIARSNNPQMLQVTNDEAGLKELIKQLPSKKRSLIVLEASGGYEQWVANGLRAKKFNVAIVNAKRVRNFAKASGKIAKTDRIDARVIMAFAKAFQPIPQALSTTEEKERLSYLNRRTQLVKMIATEKRHLEQLPKELHAGVKNHMGYLEEQLAEIEASLKEKVKEEPELQSKVEKLEAIQGIGEVTAINVLLHMPELGQLTPKEASALAGVAPYNRESGQMKGKREIAGGRAAVRCALYMAILAARRFNPTIKKFYDRLIEKGKLKKVAMVACMRKLIIIMNAMIRDNSSWQPKTY